MKKVNSIFLFSLFFIHSMFVSSQIEVALNRKSISQVWQEIIQCTSEEYIVNDIDLVFTDEDNHNLYQLFSKKPIVKTKVTFGDIFSPSINIINEIPGFENSQLSLWIDNVTFEQSFVMWNVPDIKGLNMQHCTFKKGFVINSLNSEFDLDIYNTQFNGYFNIGLSKTNRSSINLLENSFLFNYDEESLHSCTLTGSNNTRLTLKKNIFSTTDLEHTWINFEEAFYSIFIDSCKFENDLSFNKVNIANNFTITNTSFTKISMQDLVLPPSAGVAIEWKQIAKSLCIITSHFGPLPSDRNKWVLQKDPLFTGYTIEELAYFPKYEKLIASYYTLLQIYKERGDMESANSCFVEVKDIQTRRLEYLYNQKPSISSFFIWKTNQFLKFFCEYGTNPSRSVVISFYVILLFGAFYFFFYSQWDRINKSFFLNRYNALSKYLTSQTTLSEFYQSSNSKEIRTFDEFKTELKAKQNELPIYIIFLGHLLYRYSTTRYKLVSYTINKLDMQKGLWKNLKSGKKILIGGLIGFTILFFIVYIAIIKALSATMLSLNAFSTLGFGNIPVKGLSKYLTVIEGFLGWLLLSIFSVSLVAQIIQ